MEVIVVSDTKLKLILTAADLRAFGLDFETADYDSPKNKRSIWRLFEEVSARSGFEIDFDRVLVQVWQSGDGGCEMYISKMGAPPLKAKSGDGVVRYIKQLYSFDTLKDLLSVCKALQRRAYERPSQAWVSQDGKWYLLLEGEDGKKNLTSLSFVEEYGVKLMEKYASLYFEHASPIATQNAVEKLSMFA